MHKIVYALGLFAKTDLNAKPGICTHRKQQKLMIRANASIWNRLIYAPLIKTLVIGFLIATVAVSVQAATHNPDKPPAESTAAMPIGVKVVVKGVEDELRSNVLAYIPLQPFTDQPAPSPARLRYLHKQADEKIKQALQPFGFYRATVISSLEKTDKRWSARYEVTPGEQIKVGRLDIQLLGTGNLDTQFMLAIRESKLQAGKPLLHSDYETLKKRFQVLASQRGYFDATFFEHKIQINLQKYVADITLHFFTGDRYKLGAVQFNQDKPWLKNSFLNKYVEIKPGQEYDASDLQQLQGDLSNTAYYKQVELNSSPENAVDLTIPVSVDLVADKPYQYIFGVGYGTDTGARVKAGVTGRRANSLGHHYNAEVLLSQIKYGIAGEYIIPGKDPRSDTYGLRASFEDEHSNNRDYKAFNVGGYYRYREGLWMKTLALDYRVEKFKLASESETSKLLIPSIDWTRTFPAEMEKRVFATSGTWLRLHLRGGHDAFLSDTTFIQPQISAKWIHSFHNKTRLIARGTAATTWVDEFEKLPTSLRYFSGGDKSLRGYEFGIVGPALDGDVLGGKRLTEASLEFEVPIAEKWSIAVFADIGDAFNDKPDYKSGVGVGLHWLSPIGPVRIDIGHGLDDPPGDNLRLHLTIGPDL